MYIVFYIFCGTEINAIPIETDGFIVINSISEIPDILKFYTDCTSANCSWFMGKTMYYRTAN